MKLFAVVVLAVLAVTLCAAHTRRKAFEVSYRISYYFPEEHITIAYDWFTIADGEWPDVLDPYTDAVLIVR